MKQATLLIVEDEEAIRDMIRFSLPAADFHLLDAENATQAQQILADKIPDLIILDWMLPGKSGVDILQWIRQQELYKNIPIIMLTARAEEENKVKALMTGADDYVTKPFSPDELIARIKTVLRRGPLLATGGEIKVNELVLDLAQCQARFGDQLLPLSPIEYKLLHFFVKNPNKTFSRDQLISHVWGGSTYINDRTVDVQVRRLRDKLKPFKYHTHIKTVRGMGYIFQSKL